MASEKIEALIEEVKGLTVLELSELVHALEEAFGVSAAAAVAAAPAGGASDEGPAAQTEFDVVMTNAGANKIAVIKVVREITGLGLKEAKAAVEGAPAPIQEGVNKEKVSEDEANSIADKLKEAGAEIEIK